MAKNIPGRYHPWVRSHLDEIVLSFSLTSETLERSFSLGDEIYTVDSTLYEEIPSTIPTLFSDLGDDVLILDDHYSFDFQRSYSFVIEKAGDLRPNTTYVLTIEDKWTSREVCEAYNLEVLGYIAGLLAYYHCKIGWSFEKSWDKIFSHLVFNK